MHFCTNGYTHPHHTDPGLTPSNCQCDQKHQPMQQHLDVPAKSGTTHTHFSYFEHSPFPSIMCVKSSAVNQKSILSSSLNVVLPFNPPSSCIDIFKQNYSLFQDIRNTSSSIHMIPYSADQIFIDKSSIYRMDSDHLQH
jgi:hypothetical protein